MQSVSEFLNTLPSYDKNNFSRFHTDSTNRTCVKRPSVYITTEEIPSEQSSYIICRLLSVIFCSWIPRIYFRDSFKVGTPGLQRLILPCRNRTLIKVILVYVIGTFITILIRLMINFTLYLTARIVHPKNNSSVKGRVIHVTWVCNCVVIKVTYYFAVIVTEKNNILLRFLHQKWENSAQVSIYQTVYLFLKYRPSTRLLEKNACDFRIMYSNRRNAIKSMIIWMKYPGKGPD